jgi:hypothetical protein
MTAVKTKIEIIKTDFFMINTTTLVNIKIYIECPCLVGRITLHDTVKIQGLKRHFEMKNIEKKVGLKVKTEN